MLLVIPEKNLLVLDDLLHRRPAGTTDDLAAVDLSGISEMGNILASCFINAIADATHLSLSPEVPEISIDMCLPVIDSVLARFNQPGDKLLLTEAVIYGGGTENVVCHQVLFLEPESLRKLMDALAAAAAPRQSADMNGETVTVKMAEMDVVTDGRSLKTILGSCVGRDRPRSGSARERAGAHHAARRGGTTTRPPASTPTRPSRRSWRAWRPAGAARDPCRHCSSAGPRCFPWATRSIALHRRPERGSRPQDAPREEDPHHLRGHRRKCGSHGHLRQYHGQGAR